MIIVLSRTRVNPSAFVTLGEMPTVWTAFYGGKKRSKLSHIQEIVPTKAIHVFKTFLI